ncbi:SpaA isopeptide-forming pilin-related protein [Sporosarcina oncorhynchi]|uniref:SpaA isopeptide-forming pilin-related protein n=1 Tax=Sporosarcina oncorhynchi TaxID=3056444 RepID=A0ABZ0L9E5_9BACL|nr:SpaA isopeptide-forming pilin-related protein [Sporosarcina sp. T2O-4]WOV88084.1 SpaA isopeptide-forming pilin-related protein [Sporosarcina sp. T2O-4]
MKKFNIFALLLLLIGQTILGPMSTVNAQQSSPSPSFTLEEGTLTGIDGKNNIEAEDTVTLTYDWVLSGPIVEGQFQSISLPKQLQAIEGQTGKLYASEEEFGEYKVVDNNLFVSFNVNNSVVGDIDNNEESDKSIDIVDVTKTSLDTKTDDFKENDGEGLEISEVEVNEITNGYDSLNQSEKNMATENTIRSTNVNGAGTISVKTKLAEKAEGPFIFNGLKYSVKYSGTNEMTQNQTDDEISETKDKNEELNKSIVTRDLNSNTILKENSAILDQLITGVSIYDKEPTYDDKGNLIINGNNIGESDIKIDVGSTVAIIYNWGLRENHGYKSGDAFTFTLPSNFATSVALKGELDGGFGSYVVTPDGEVTFTFNEEIELDQALSGYFYVWRSFDSYSNIEGLEQNIDFSSVGLGSIKVNFNNPKSDKITKTGETDKNMNPGKISWTVDFNLNEEEIQNAIFSDVFSTGLSFNDDVEIYELKVMIDGSLEQDDEILIKEIEEIENGFKINFGTIKKAYRVKYSTNVNPILTAPYKGSIGNQAVVVGEGNPPLTVSKEMEVQFSKPLDKKVEQYDEKAQEIKWSIQYNYNEQTINNPVLTDTFDVNHQELDLDSFIVTEKKVQDNGNATTVRDLERGKDYEVTKENDGFKLTFKNSINLAYEIVYTTKAKNRIHEDEVTVTNKVAISGVKPVEKSKEIGQVIFHKSVGEIDYGPAKTIEWKLSLNEDAYTMDNVAITDKFVGQNLILLPDSVTISGLVKDVDYTVLPNNTYEEGFKITFIKKIKNLHYISYKTKFDSTKPAPTEGYKNTAELNWTENEIPQSPIKKSVTVPVDNYTNENGNKTGAYNAKTKEITWTIDINYNLHEINEAIITDTYTGDQEFIAGSLEVHHLKLKGGENQVEIDNSLPKPLSKFNKTGNGFTLDLGKIDSAYRIIYKTTLKNTEIKGVYQNHAILTDGEEGTKLFEKKATVTPKNGEQYAKKSGSQGAGADADIATWTVNLNFSQTHINEQSIVTDTLSSNQILLNDSFKLYTTVIPEDNSGKVSRGLEANPDIYSIDVQGNTFTLTFKQDVDTAYILVYQSFINAGHGEKITNEVNYSGTATNLVGETDKKEVIVELAGAGGGANPPKGKIKILKVDDEGNPLPNVVFELYNASGTVLLESLTTLENGEATTENEYKYYPSGIKYKLKEISAPQGYLIDPEYAKGKEIKFVGSDTKISITNKKIRQTLEFTKTDLRNGKTLNGVTFGLHKKDNDGKYHLVSGHENVVTKDGGKIIIENLEPGNYQLVEVKAADGYWLDKKPKEFTIIKDQTEVTKETMVNDRVGELKLRKVANEDESKFLSGAKFRLVNKENDKIFDEKTSDSNGWVTFTGIKYGTYTLEEIEAPSGYIVTNNLADVVINSPTKTLEKSIKNEKIIQAVKLVKVDKADNNIKLSGAEFTLYKKDTSELVTEEVDGKTVPVKRKTNSNGELFVNNLEPGEYYFQETKAPEHYLLGENRKTEVFEIKKDQTAFTEVTMENKRGTGSLVITKQDAVSKAVLSDTEFELFNSKGESYGKKVTNVAGEIKFDKLPYDTYTLKETKAKSGYVPNNQEYVIVVSDADVDGKEFTKTITNQKINRSVLLTKYNADKTLVLPNAVFELRKMNSSLPEGYEVVSTIGPEKLITNQNGTIYLDELLPGSYEFVETQAPSGYYVNNEPVSFTITTYQTSTVPVEKTNNRIPDPVWPGPVEPGKPVDPDKPKPVEPGKPVDPNKPDPTDPTEPGKPGEEDPTDPTEPGKPGEEDPLDPTKPGKPGIDPTKPGNNGSVEGEGGSKVPGNTNKPGKGNKPGSGTVQSGGGSKNPNANASGKETLPQTGEQLYLYMTILGFVLILAGGFMVRRRKTNE